MAFYTFPEKSPAQGMHTLKVLRFAVGDVYRPQRESVPPLQIVGKLRGEDGRRLMRLSLIDFPQTDVF